MRHLFTSSSSFLSTGILRPLRALHYVQGQSPEPKIREYFYYIDHQGQLFLDDAKIKNFTSCFKEKNFLEFFYKRLRVNSTRRYPEFPYLSPCGRERNYIRCDDRPIVFTELITDKYDSTDYLYYGGYKANLRILFEPEKLCMLPKTGRVYHPASIIHGGIGLVKSSLAIEFSKGFDFENGESKPPTHFVWNNKVCKLTNELISFFEKNE